LTGLNVAVVAEIKRRSPSKGWIKPGLAAADTARAYEAGGAAAVSVLTEPKHFGGSVDDLIAARDNITIPVLKKDFHIEPIQLLEARALGASAALLIARALSPDELRRLALAARDLALEVLIEVRDEEELARAMECDPSMIGVNNRNLETLAIDAAMSERLIGMIPRTVVAVMESGVTSRADVERAARIGADAVLVGSAMSAADDATAAVKALTGVPRVLRAG
jgi:indole-3-glycerol phosphate synthase